MKCVLHVGRRTASVRQWFTNRRALFPTGAAGGTPIYMYNPPCSISTTSVLHKQSPFEILRLNEPGRHHNMATEQEVKKAYREAAIRTHPDQGGTAAAFRRATDAYEECLRIVLNFYNSRKDGNSRTTSSKDESADHIKWAASLELFIKHKDLRSAWKLWQSRIYTAPRGSLGRNVIEIGLKMCAAGELREALGLLAEIEGRDLFSDHQQREVAYNSLLWHCKQQGNQGDMDLILEILDVMDRKKIQPDLGLLDLEIFTFFPRAN